MSTDKCPHCGAESTKFRNIGGFFKCYSFQSGMGFHKTDYCQERSAHAATKRELDAAKANSAMWHQRYDVQKQAHELSELGAKKAESRVRELEGLASQVVRAWKTFDLAEGDWERTDSERTLSNSIETLGEAMVGASVAHGKTCPKVPHFGTGHLHAEDDDKPYDVDGVSYCGRCHHAIPGGGK